MQKQMDTMLSHLESYKARQDRIVLGLGAIQKAAQDRDVDAVQVLISGLLLTDLRESKEKVYHWRMALKIAVEGLQRHAKLKDVEESLSQVNALVPEVFQELVAQGAPEVVN